MADNNSEFTVKERTERAMAILRQAAADSCAGEPLEIIQYIMFRSYVLEAHHYALLDQLRTGKLDADELQQRFSDHVEAAAGALTAKFQSLKALHRRSKNGGH
jgi:hypothetical protein